MKYQLSENIQQGVLFLLKHDVDFYTQIAAIVKPEYFEFPSHRKIFSAIKLYYEKYGKLPSDDTLLEFIKFLHKDEEDDTDYENDILYINNIDQSVINDREFILDLVEDFAKKGAMTNAIRKSIILLKENKIGHIEELVREALLVSRDINVGQNYFSDVNSRIHRLFEKRLENRFKTVFPDFNRNLEGGLCAKELAIVIAPPGVGKSLYLVNQGVASLKEGRNVLYISCEMSEDKIAARFDSILTLLKNNKLKEAETQLTLRKRLSMVEETLEGRLYIKEFPTGTGNVNTIRALLTQLRLYKNFVPDVIIVDYLELLRPNRMIESEYMAQQRIAEELRGLACEQKCLVWTASQTNRQARRVQLITDSELVDSYGKIRPADWVISLNQTEEEYDRGRMRVYVVKARDSKQRYAIGISIDYSTLRMEQNNNIEDDDEEEFEEEVI